MSAGFQVASPPLVLLAEIRIRPSNTAKYLSPHSPRTGYTRLLRQHPESYPHSRNEPMRRLLLVVLAELLLSAGPVTAAHSELPCSALIRGFVLRDSDILAQSLTIAAPLMAIGWSSTAMMDEAVQTVPYKGMWRDLLVHQLVRHCQTLPGESVDSIVDTLLKAARRPRTEQ